MKKDIKNQYYKFSDLNEVFDENGNPKNYDAWYELNRMAAVVCNTFYYGRHKEVGIELAELVNVALLNGLLAGKKAKLRGLKTRHGWSLVFSGMRYGTANYLARMQKHQENFEPSEVAWRF